MVEVLLKTVSLSKQQRARSERDADETVLILFRAFFLPFSQQRFLDGTVVHLLYLRVLLR